jgi:hypothetical protein
MLFRPDRTPAENRPGMFCMPVFILPKPPIPRSTIECIPPTIFWPPNIALSSRELDPLETEAALLLALVAAPAIA